MNHWRYLSENSSRPPRNIRPGYKCGFGFADHKQVVEGFWVCSRYVYKMFCLLVGFVGEKASILHTERKIQVYCMLLYTYYYVTMHYYYIVL